MIDIAIMVAVLGGGAFALKLLTSKGDREADETWTIAARRVGGRWRSRRVGSCAPRSAGSI